MIRNEELMTLLPFFYNFLSSGVILCSFYRNFVCWNFDWQVLIASHITSIQYRPENSTVK